jgi:DNA polymerase-3 subunit epsilon
MGIRFAAIDFETTGLDASANRAIEIGIVIFSGSGEILNTFESLINAKRDVGRSDIHGIQASDLQQAPSFSEIASEVLSLLDETVLVAHNKSFDFRFLKREFGLLGIELGDFDGLCTMELMSASFSNSPRKLGECCRFLGIPLGTEHSALDDALMAAKIASHVIGEFGFPAIPEPLQAPHILLNPGKPLRRSEVRPIQISQGNFLTSLLDKLPVSNLNNGRLALPTMQYMSLLDRVLEDRLIDENEAIFLQMTTADLGLSYQQTQMINSTYFAALCRAAQADGHVSDDEKNDLRMVGQLLDIQDWEDLLLQKQLNTSDAQSQSSNLIGLSVCFTGRMQFSRAQCENIAQQKGLIVQSRVTKDLDLLVVGDPLTASTKAEKARSYGTRIIYQKPFFDLLGIRDVAESFGDDQPFKKKSKRRSPSNTEFSFDDEDDDEDEEFDSEFERELEAETSAIRSSVQSMLNRRLSENEIVERLRTLKRISIDAQEEIADIGELRTTARSVLLDLCLHINSLRFEVESLTSQGKAVAEGILDYLFHHWASINQSDKSFSDPNYQSFLSPYFVMKFLDIEDFWIERSIHVQPSDFIQEEIDTDFEKPEVANLLVGKSIVITGDFIEFSRDDGRDAILKRGGKSPSSVSGRTYALILGENSGPVKFAQSVEKGIPMLGVSGFRYLLTHGHIEGTLDTPPFRKKDTKRSTNDVNEVLTCKSCGDSFSRLRVKGRKPHFCPKCET